MATSIIESRSRGPRWLDVLAIARFVALVGSIVGVIRLWNSALRLADLDPPNGMTHRVGASLRGCTWLSIALALGGTGALLVPALGLSMLLLAGSAASLGLVVVLLLSLASRHLRSALDEAIEKPAWWFRVGLFALPAILVLSILASKARWIDINSAFHVWFLACGVWLLVAEWYVSWLKAAAERMDAIAMTFKTIDSNSPIDDKGPSVAVENPAT